MLVWGIDTIALPIFIPFSLHFMISQLPRADPFLSLSLSLASDTDLIFPPRRILPILPLTLLSTLAAALPSSVSTEATPQLSSGGLASTGMKPPSASFISASAAETSLPVTASALPSYRIRLLPTDPPTITVALRTKLVLLSCRTRSYEP